MQEGSTSNLPLIGDDINTEDILGAGYYVPEQGASSKQGIVITENHFNRSAEPQGRRSTTQSREELRRSDDDLYLFQRMRSFIRRQQ